jgi:phospholipase/carboxylesterase
MNHPETKPLTERAKKLVVMLHGVGSDGYDLISLVPYIQDSLPDCHFLSPHGIEAYDMAPFGRQWFSLRDRAPDVLKKLVEKNAPIVMDIIKQKQTELGLTNADTILLGFSQGTMLGMHLTLSQKEPFAAMIAFSGMLLPPSTLNNKKTPFCIIHGAEDDVVYARESQNTANYLTQNHIEHQSLIVQNLKHSIDDSGIEFALKFIKEH